MGEFLTIYINLHICLTAPTFLTLKYLEKMVNYFHLSSTKH